MWTSLTIHKKQRAPGWFFCYIRWSNLIKKWLTMQFLVIFWRMEKVLRAITLIFMFFLLHLKMIWKEIAHQNHNDWTLGKKIRVLGALLTNPISKFWFQHMHKVLSNWTSFINLINDGIFSKIVQLHWSFFRMKAT